MFHHFHGPSHKKTQGSISSKQLQKIIIFLKKNYNLINANDFLYKFINKKFEKKDVCLTFDDALKSQVDIALPVLYREEIQAFFFLYSNAFEKNFNKLEVFRDFRTTRYKKIDLFYEDFFFKFKKEYPKKYKIFKESNIKKYLSKYTFYSFKDRQFRFCRDKILSKKHYEALMLNLMKDKKYNFVKEKNKILMSKQDVKRILNYNQLIGLHSHAHALNMDKLNYNEQLLDYKKNLTFFKKNFKITPKSMSHPYGRYNQSSLKALKKIGIKLGFLSNFTKKKIFSSLEVPRYDHIYMTKRFSKNKL